MSKAEKQTDKIDNETVRNKDNRDTQNRDAENRDAADGRSENLRDSAMMAYLMDALEEGTDIGHYGRLVFAMVARFFMSDDELVDLLSKQPGFSQEEARALVLQVNQRGYNPPKRERILQWQEQQDFPICPTPNDPNSCNVYSELRLPDEIYANIEDFWQERAEAQQEQNA